MDRLRFYICLALIALPLSGAPPAATVPSRDGGVQDNGDIALDLSICLGRASAALEYAHLIGETPFDEQTRLQIFRALFETVLSSQSSVEGREFFARRLQAKMDLSRLLTLAKFNDDARLANKARIDAMLQLRQCDDLIS